MKPLLNSILRNIFSAVELFLEITIASEQVNNLHLIHEGTHLCLKLRDFLFQPKDNDDGYTIEELYIILDSENKVRKRGKVGINHNIFITDSLLLTI